MQQQTTQPSTAQPVLMVFKEIMPGDVRKQAAESADADTGGGARDFRISPANTYSPILLRFFPLATADPDMYHGWLLWRDAAGVVRRQLAILDLPNLSRNSEIRITRINEIRAWDIDEPAYTQDIAQNLRWFFVLELDNNGDVFARILKQQDLQYESVLINRHVTNRIANHINSHHAIKGAIEFATGQLI